MKKRLRKKLKVGEFKQVGLDITIQLSKEIDKDDKFYSEFLNIVECNSFLFAGGFYSNEIKGYLYEFKYKQNVSLNLQNIKNSLMENSIVDRIYLGEKQDLWN